MRLDLKDIIHVPGASKDFQFQLDLSQLEFLWLPSHQPAGRGRGHRDQPRRGLELTDTALLPSGPGLRPLGKEFSREKAVPLDCLLADELEDEENDEIVLLEGSEVDLDELVTTAFVLAMDTKNLCSEDCKGLCAKCGADLNLGPCGCRPEVDPRLAALAQLLDDEN